MPLVYHSDDSCRAQVDPKSTVKSHRYLELVVFGTGTIFGSFLDVRYPLPDYCMSTLHTYSVRLLRYWVQRGRSKNFALAPRTLTVGHAVSLGELLGILVDGGGDGVHEGRKRLVHVQYNNNSSKVISQSDLAREMNRVCLGSLILKKTVSERGSLKR